MFDSPFIVPVAAFVITGLTMIFYPLARAFARRMESDARRPQVPAEITARLERMEQALDTIAIEVERISEGQRFTTKLLAEHSEERTPGAPPARE